MTDKQVNTVIEINHSIAAGLVLIGAFFKIQHYPNGFLILIIGFTLGSVTSFVDTLRLKKRIKTLEEKLKKKLKTCVNKS